MEEHSVNFMKSLRVSNGSASILLLIIGVTVALSVIVLGRQVSTTQTQVSSYAQAAMPTAPTLVSITGDSTKIILTWLDNSNNETDFILLKSGSYTGITIGANATSLTTITYSCLVNNGQSFSIAARNAQGSVSSNSLTVSCLATSPSPSLTPQATVAPTSITPVSTNISPSNIPTSAISVVPTLDLSYYSPSSTDAMIFFIVGVMIVLITFLH